MERQLGNFAVTDVLISVIVVTVLLCILMSNHQLHTLNIYNI